MTSENGKPKDKRSVIASKIKSALKLFHIQCYWPCCDGFDLLGIRWHNMSEKSNFPSKEVTLSRHQSKTRSVLIRSSTYRRWRMWSLKVRAQMMNARQCVRLRPLSVRFISRVTLAGPFVNPKGITLHCNCPWWIEKAVLGQSSSLTCICQYPEAKSRLESHRNPLTRHPSKVVVWHPSLSTGNVYDSQCMYGMSRHVS